VIATVWAPTFVMAKWLAIPCGLLGGGWSVGLFAALQYMLPSVYRASATALFVAVTTLLGYFIGPWLTGALSQAFGDDAASLQLALTIIVPVGVVASALAFLAASRLERDRIALAEAD
jgi:MFS family permease